MNDLEKAILKTTAFFDVFSYPLTASEIFKWLYNPQQIYTLANIRETLKNSQILKKELATKEGFYYIKGREHI